jgi:hypothetical protein
VLGISSSFCPGGSLAIPPALARVRARCSGSQKRAKSPQYLQKCPIAGLAQW